jgi:hypothetical protein
MILRSLVSRLDVLSDTQKKVRQEATLKKRLRQREELEQHCKARVDSEGRR